MLTGTGLCVSPETKLLFSVAARPGGNGLYFYNRCFAELGIDAVYLACRASGLRGFREGAELFGVHGFSIAAPFKQAIVPLLDELTDVARATASVNSVRRVRDGLLGHNTDEAGLRSVLSGWRERGRRVLIFGSGGVVSSAVRALRALFPDCAIALGARNETAGRALCGRLGLQWVEDAAAPRADLWINATPLSESDPERLLRMCANASAVFDLPPLQQVSAFEAAVRARGQAFLRGFDFYRAQFLEQFRFFFDADVPAALFDRLAAQRPVAPPAGRTS